MRRHLLLVASLIAVVSAPFAQAQRERFPPEDREIVEKRWPEAKRTATSLRYIVLKEGDPKSGTPKPGEMIAAQFKGSLLDGTVFDQSKPGEPLVIRIGRENLIPAWEEVLQQMHVGEKRLIVVPYELGYGTRGRPPTIPRRATLVFEMELVGFGPQYEPKP